MQKKICIYVGDDRNREWLERQEGGASAVINGLIEDARLHKPLLEHIERLMTTLGGLAAQGHLRGDQTARETLDRFVEGVVR